MFSRKTKLFSAVLAVTTLAGCVHTATISNQPTPQSACNISLSDNRMSAGMVELKAMNPLFSMGPEQTPFLTAPKVHELLMTQMCSDKQIATSGLIFELERFYCETEAAFTYNKAIAGIQLSFIDKNGTRKRSFLTSKVTPQRTYSFTADLCAVAIEKAMGELNDTLRRDAGIEKGS